MSIVMRLTETLKSLVVNKKYDEAVVRLSEAAKAVKEASCVEQPKVEEVANGYHKPTSKH